MADPAPNPFIQDYVSILRSYSAQARDVFFKTSSHRQAATILGYDAAIVPGDLADAHADITVEDVALVNAFYDGVTAQFAAHPEQLQALLKLARKP